MLAAEYKEKPKCEIDSCLPYLRPENKALFEIWSQCRYQWIMGPSGAVDIQLQPIIELVKMYQIDQTEQIHAVNLVSSASRHILHKLRKRERKREKKEKNRG